MKTILTILCLLCVVNVSAQKATGNSLKFESIIKIDSVDRSELYSRSLQWFSKYFTSSNDVVQSKDEKGGLISGKFSIKSNVPYNQYMPTGQFIDANIEIAVKDGKIKYTLSDFSHSSYGIITDGIWEDKGLGKGMRIRYYTQLQKDSNENAQEIIKSITEFFTKMSIANNKNW
jgi:hypothetical protein